jgi:hypothetical protein
MSWPLNHSGWASAPDFRVVTVRDYDRDGPAWWVAIPTGAPCACGASSMAVADAVVDDFGNVVLVSGWH